MHTLNLLDDVVRRAARQLHGLPEIAPHCWGVEIQRGMCRWKAVGYYGTHAIASKMLEKIKAEDEFYFPWHDYRIRPCRRLRWM